jgi:hypothetical protein
MIGGGDRLHRVEFEIDIAFRKKRTAFEIYAVLFGVTKRRAVELVDVLTDGLRAPGAADENKRNTRGEQEQLARWLATRRVCAALRTSIFPSAIPPRESPAKASA